MNYVDLIYLWQSWLILAVLLLMAEILIGGNFLVFFPSGLSAASISLILFSEPSIKIYFSFTLLDWRIEILLFGLFSLLFSLLIQKFSPLSKRGYKDISKY